MDRHNVAEHGKADTYLIPGAETNQFIAGPNFEIVENMYSEGVPEFVVDQGMYFPTATNYDYYCTGFGTPIEWKDHNRIFGTDGPEVQYMGIQSESLPHVYYSPTYGYTESPYNPYNPYIPGAMIGVDGPFPGAQQFCPLTPYHNTVSLPFYYSVLVPPDLNSPDTLSNHGTANVSRLNGRTHKNIVASASNPFSSHSSKGSSNTRNSLSRSSEIPRDNFGLGKPAISHGSISTVAGNVSNLASSRALQGRNASSLMQHVDPNFSGKAPSRRSHVNVGFADFGGSAHGWSTAEKARPRVPIRRQEVVSGSLDVPGEQNCGPRSGRPKSQLAVKAYTTKAGKSNTQGIIVIDIDQYNKDSFPIDYEDAKFFVIKSYSEDDVHKSIKYNVWSSTPHGNKKLQSAYEDARNIAAGKPKGCPIFLSFSVNASGQFCGVAEMTGPVDSFKDMDFWQQDKWSGSFPVKWHMIKDVQNSAFRHIILENNENKPVTNSRDTQEIMYKQGLEMLKIFKNHGLKTSILDDFMYYENRQKIMQEERARLLVRSFHAPFSMPILDPPRRLMNTVSGTPAHGKINEQKDTSNPRKCVALEKEQVPSNPDVTIAGATILRRPDQLKIQEIKDNAVPSLKTGSLTISPLQAEPVPVAAAAAAASTAAGIAVKSETRQNGAVTEGSMSVEVNGFNGIPGSLTVGSIPLDTRALLGSKEGSTTKVAAPTIK